MGYSRVLDLVLQGYSTGSPTAGAARYSRRFIGVCIHTHAHTHTHVMCTCIHWALPRYCKRRFHQSAGDDALRADIFNVNAHLWATDPALRAEVRSRVPRVPREYLRADV